MKNGTWRCPVVLACAVCVFSLLSAPSCATEIDGEDDIAAAPAPAGASPAGAPAGPAPAGSPLQTVTKLLEVLSKQLVEEEKEDNTTHATYLQLYANETDRLTKSVAKNNATLTTLASDIESAKNKKASESGKLTVKTATLSTKEGELSANIAARRAEKDAFKKKQTSLLASKTMFDLAIATMGKKQPTSAPKKASSASLLSVAERLRSSLKDSDDLVLNRAQEETLDDFVESAKGEMAPSFLQQGSHARLSSKGSGGIIRTLNTLVGKVNAALKEVQDAEAATELLWLGDATKDGTKKIQETEIQGLKDANKLHRAAILQCNQEVSAKSALILDTRPVYETEIADLAAKRRENTKKIMQFGHRTKERDEEKTAVSVARKLIAKEVHNMYSKSNLAKESAQAAAVAKAKKAKLMEATYMERSLVAFEGNDVPGSIIPFQGLATMAKCKHECSKNPKCHSFAVCSKGRSGCFMKDKVVTATEPASAAKEAVENQCKTWYEAADLFSTSSSSFIQISMQKASHAMDLHQLAMKAHRLKQTGKGVDPFVKVKTLIKGMLKKLNAAQAASKTKMAKCKHDNAVNAKSMANKKADVARITGRMNNRKSDLTETNKSSATAKTTMIDVKHAVALAKGIRTTESLQANANMLKYKTALKGLGAAVKAMNGFYRKKAAKTHWNPRKKKTLAKDRSNTAAKSKTRAQAGDGIISILEIAVADFSKLLDDTKSTEKTSQDDYVAMERQSDINIATYTKDISYMKIRMTELGDEIAEMTATILSDSKIVKSLEAMKVAIDKICIIQPPTYAEKKAKREAELASLKEALGLLAPPKV